MSRLSFLLLAATVCACGAVQDLGDTNADDPGGAQGPGGDGEDAGGGSRRDGGGGTEDGGSPTPRGQCIPVSGGTLLSANLVVAGDFDGDTKPDLIGGSPAGVLSFARGRGDGSFDEPKASGTFLQQDRWEKLVAVDLDKDGKLDLLAASQQDASNVVYVLHGNGDGTFATVGTIGTGPASLGRVALLAVDLDADGYPDLVTRDLALGKIDVRLNDKKGTFGSALPVAVGAVPETAAAGDLDGDGKVDLVVTHTSDDGAWTNGATVGVLLGNGDGSFRRGPALMLSTRSVAVGDLDGDGRAEIVLGDVDSDAAILAFEGGQLKRRGTAADLVYVGELGLVDVNDDGRLDLVAATQELVVALGKGDGTFDVPRRYFEGGDLLVTADFNGDGVLDVFANGRVVGGNGDGTFQAERKIVRGLNTTAPAVGDFDGDGRPDIVASGVIDGVGPESIWLALSRPVEQFEYKRVTTGTLRRMIAADVTADGKLDLVALTGSVVRVFIGKGDGTFSGSIDTNIVPNGSSSSVGMDLAVGKIDGDGHVDLFVLALTSNAQNAPRALHALRGMGNGQFVPATPFVSDTYATAIASEDFDDDDRHDLLVMDPGLKRVELFSNRAGSFARASLATLEPVSVHVARLTPKARPSVAIVDKTGALRLISPVAPSGYGNPVTMAGLEVGSTSVTSGDVDGDGRVDLAVAGGGLLQVTLADAAGVFSPTRPTWLPTLDVRTLLASDVDADGRADLVMSHVDVGVLHGRCLGGGVR